jgi:hypothetical protein
MTVGTQLLDAVGEARGVLARGGERVRWYEEPEEVG